jgi:hypothetical protein
MRIGRWGLRTWQVGRAGMVVWTGDGGLGCRVVARRGERWGLEVAWPVVVVRRTADKAMLTAVVRVWSLEY